MKDFKYADEYISEKDIMIAVPSVVIAIGILQLPRSIAEETVAADGWLSILAGGIMAMLIVWVVAKLASRFPGQSFLEYASSLITKPAAIILLFLFVIQSILLSAYEVRAIAGTAHRYLFEETPVEVVALSFLLIVIYAVAGSRAGIFRLNALFLPIVFFLSFILILFSIGFIDIDNLLPVFQTDMRGYVQATREGVLSYTGIGILFFYIAFVRNPRTVAQKAVYGLSKAVLLYIFLFITCIAVFGNVSTANITYPTVELSKAVEIPGGFFERFEALFFVIWIMAIFNTTVMAFDIGLLLLKQLFPNVRKERFVIVLSPFVFYISTIPRNYNELDLFGTIMSHYGLLLTVAAALILWIAAKFKGVKQGEKN
ncbi:GerAB/ArcD/ProY family transporter [Virgibacillus sediminis]|uniref:Endospore germination permease n=1 Tax=Virgibacillus sediminis TaxID=202260 RepID=A0ABV7A8Q6_9BACI